MDLSVLPVLVWIGHISSILTLIGVGWGLWKWQQESRRIDVYVTCGPLNKHIGSIPARFASRGEINGLVGQSAKGARIDLSGYRHDYGTQQARIDVPLNQEDFERLA